MGIINVSLSILDPLYMLFGWLTKNFFIFFGNYGLAIIALTILIRGLLIPLNIKSQKSMIKMQALSGKSAELQRKYGDDKQKYQEELVKLQKENGAGFSGCLLPVLQLFLIWPIYRIVSGPLYYLSGVSKENISTMIDMAKEADILSKGNISPDIHILLVEALQNNSTFLAECVRKGLITMSQMVDLHFLGLDLTMIPAWKPLTIMSDPKTYLPLLVIPILVVLVQVAQLRLTNILKPGNKEQKEAKEREKLNPARAGQSGNPAEQSSEMTMKMMNIMMPAMMLWTTFIMPAAMGLYWIVSGIMGILTQLLVYALFTRPYEQKKKEMEEKKAQAFKKKKETDASEDAEKNKGKKNKKGRK